jgi:hypothetical protein
MLEGEIYSSLPDSDRHVTKVEQAPVHALQLLTVFLADLVLPDTILSDTNAVSPPLCHSETKDSTVESRGDP